MKLTDWLATSQMSPTDLARHLGVSKQAVSGWQSGAFGPSRKNLLALMTLTEGQVGVADFADIAPADRQDALDVQIAAE